MTKRRDSIISHHPTTNYSRKWVPEKIQHQEWNIKTELEPTFDMILDESKTEIKSDTIKTYSSFNMKLSALTSNKHFSYHDQPSNDIIKRPLLKSPEKSSHTSQLT